MISEALLAILACPRCRGRLIPDRDALRCPSCPAVYPVRDGIPILTLKDSSADGR